MNEIKNQKSVDVARQIKAAAKRALTEAQERKRAVQAEHATNTPVKEINGRGGLDPVRYGDWEKKGIAVDF